MHRTRLLAGLQGQRAVAVLSERQPRMDEKQADRRVPYHAKQVDADADATGNGSVGSSQTQMQSVFEDGGKDKLATSAPSWEMRQARRACLHRPRFALLR